MAGFTLAELLVTVSIVGILASVAVPSYRRVVERSYWRAAQDILQTIYAGEWVFRSQSVPETFVNPAACPAPPASPGPWRCIYMDNPNVGTGIPVTFTVTGVTATAFLATASHVDGRCMTINQTRTLNLSPPSCTAWLQP